MIVDTLLVVVLALTVGLGTAWHMIDEGSALTTGSVGPWSVWHAAGNPDADPYTRAHVARSGRLPITSTSAAYYFASNDESGKTLTSNCDYVLEGRSFNAAWWSLTVYDKAGRLVANKARRHSFSGREMALRPDGSYRVVLASPVRPGNWLPTGKAKQVKLVMRVYGPRNDSDNEDRLPSIRREACR